MGTISIRIVHNPDSKPFADDSILDTCVDPQFNGVFPDDPGLGIVSERKANVEFPRESRQISGRINQRPSQKNE